MKTLECSKPPSDLQVHQKAHGELRDTLKEKLSLPGHRSQTCYLGAKNTKARSSEGTEKSTEAAGVTEGSQRVQGALKGPRSELKGTQRLLGCTKRQRETPEVA